MEEIKSNVESTDKSVQINTYRDSVIEAFVKEGKLPVWGNYYAVSKFKSVKRAIRKGQVDLFTGVVYPNRPFNNRSDSRGRKMNQIKKQIYEQFKSRTV